MAPTIKKPSLVFSSIPESTQNAIDVVKHESWLLDEGWYLAGGTALALQFGQRESYDLDFFTPQADIDAETISRRLSRVGAWTISTRDHGTLYGVFDEVKCSFIAYPQCKPQEKFISLNNIRLIDGKDIAVMKILAISQRCTKRDFFDLYWYTKEREQLEDIINRISKVYPNKNHNLHHIFKSLLYFADAESDPDPKIYFDATWEGVKKYFEKNIPTLARKMLELE